jgi:hypothetical protein
MFMQTLLFALAWMATGLLLNGAAQGQSTSGWVSMDITGRFGADTPTTPFTFFNFLLYD